MFTSLMLLAAEQMAFSAADDETDAGGNGARCEAELMVREKIDLLLKLRRV